VTLGQSAKDVNGWYKKKTNAIFLLARTKEEHRRKIVYIGIGKRRKNMDVQRETKYK
jgi:hypothetical protein